MKERHRAVILSLTDRLLHKANEAPSVPEPLREDMRNSLTTMSISLKEVSTLLKKLGSSLSLLGASLRDGEVENSSGEVQDKALQGEVIIPICMYCKKIRNDKDQWETNEECVDSGSSARFSHGICTDCFAEHLGKPE